MEKINTNTNELHNKSSDGFAGDSKAALSSSLNHADSSLEQVKESALSSFNDAKNKWFDIEHAILAKGQEAGKAGRIYIYQNPFKSILVASATGLAIGFLLSMLRK